MYTCQTCGSISPPKPGTLNKFCSLKCANIHLALTRTNKSKEKYYISPLICFHCNTIIPYEKHRDKLKNIKNKKTQHTFCSSSCAASYTGKIYIKKKKGVKQKPNPVPRKLFSKTCIVCENPFYSKYSTVKHCSKECTNKTLSIKHKLIMKQSPSRKYNRNPQRQSYMEESFEDWLKTNGMNYGRKGYLTEINIHNKTTNKYGRLDFVFPSLRIIIELDGTHHNKEPRKTLDKIRDGDLIRRGWIVFRIKYKNYLKQLHVTSLSKVLFKQAE